MNRSRDNHYVPRWYQEGFFEPGRKTLAYLDLTPPHHALPDGRTVPARSRFESPTSRCFVQRDLYSTFFGTEVNDEIERHLFGAIDNSAAPAVKAFTSNDADECHRHFQTLFDYLDIQKARTPKGLDWLRAQYPSLSQNELMLEMQGVRMMNCTIWTEAVREIVSAEDADVKFIVTDHPVTIYNHAVGPGDAGCAYPQDPSIAFKASQTIFPLNREVCLILTHLEYAKDPAVNPLEKRTFARNYRNTFVRTDAFIRTRSLNRREVSQINTILKARARRFIAAGREEWLYPDQQVTDPWSDLGVVLRPPPDGVWSFGGEVYVRFDDGRVHYQDQFGRTEKPYERLQKQAPTSIGTNARCGCGSDRPYKVCCEPRPVHLRPSWTEQSIRERNLALYRAVVDILGLEPEKPWVEVRRDLTDERISRLYGVYAALWPLETDLLQLLPKPDGRARAVYTGAIHPALINEFAVGASTYFGEVLIEHPFLHARTVGSEFSPIENPQAFRQEVLKAVLTFLTLTPLVESGSVNLIPDPCNFDFHLRDQMMRMAQERTAGRKVSINPDDRTFKAMEADMRRSLMLMPRHALAARLAKGVPGLEHLSVDDMLKALEDGRLHDPLATLQPDSLGGGEGGGQLTLMKLAPNFEMAMYLAQATGACIITDSSDRWAEISDALRWRWADPHEGIRPLAAQIERSVFAFPQGEMDVMRLSTNKTFAAYPTLMRDAFRYLTERNRRGAKPNYEVQLGARFARIHAAAQSALKRESIDLVIGRIRAALPAEGVQHNTVNRLLLMSSSQHHLTSLPMAFFLERATPSA